jgi:hypothetical protein
MSADALVSMAGATMKERAAKWPTEEVSISRIYVSERSRKQCGKPIGGLFTEGNEGNKGGRIKRKLGFEWEWAEDKFLATDWGG